MNELLQQGIVAARAGQREEARALLMCVVEADEQNEQAWLWLAGVIDDPEDIRTCLENVLDLNPTNVKAQQGLAWVNQRYGPPAPRAAEDTAPDEPTTAAPQPDLADLSPSQQHSYTGPTTRLSDAPALAALSVQPPQPAAQVQSPQPALVAPATAPASTAENPCPYCGAPTAFDQRRCTQCHSKLMLRGEPPAKRSAALTVLAVFWGISGVLTIIGALLSLLGALLAYQGLRIITLRANPRATMSFPIELLLPTIVLLIIAGLTFAVMRGLLRRERWAYFIAIFFTVLGVIGMLLNVAQGAVILRELPQQLQQMGTVLPPSALNLITTLIGVILIIAVISELVNILLVWFSYQDFFGPLARFLPEVGPGSHMEHYNNGVAYKDRGMWYMATKEWEMAVQMSPRDLSYLHALGLAYAQLRRFDQARATLDNALQIAPNHEQLRQSRALLDQLAARKA